MLKQTQRNVKVFSAQMIENRSVNFYIRCAESKKDSVNFYIRCAENKNDYANCLIRYADN